jgi:hypothetical protein
MFKLWVTQVYREVRTISHGHALLYAEQSGAYALPYAERRAEWCVRSLLHAFGCYSQDYVEEEGTRGRRED